MKFYSRKGNIIIFSIIILTILTIISIWGKVYPASFILIIVLSFVIWTWFDTYYVISNDQLFYKLAFIKGSVNINTIFEVVKNKASFSGVKPALSTKGIIVKYNRWDEIYISPLYIDQFIIELKKVNPSIKITE